MQKVAFIYPIIRTDFIEKSIDSLLPTIEKGTYRIIIVDQSIEGLRPSTIKFLYENDHLYLRIKNQGFSKAANLGIIEALHRQVPYIAVVNDDTVFMYPGWFEDAIEEFKTDPNIVAVCPESPRVAGWGYGLSPDKYIEVIPYKEQFTPEDITYLKSGDYDKDAIQLHHDFKIPDTFPMTKRGVVDAIAMWCPIFKREAFIELGLFEEKFVWGGGEDYDMNARAYSCAWPIDRVDCDPNFHRRMVSTMKSWVWHWWGQSKDVKSILDPRLFEGKNPWNNNNELWGDKFDVWGHWDDNGVRRPVRRKAPPLIEPL